jgi:hypothetical protein
MDSDLAALCAEANRSPSRTYPTFGVALASLPDAHWSALTPTSPLRRFCLIDFEADQRLTTTPLRIEERVLHYLVGVSFLEPLLQVMLQKATVPKFIAEEHRVVAEMASRLLRDDSAEAPVIQLCGDDPLGQEDIAATIAGARAGTLFVARTEDLPAIGPELDRFIALWGRESRLLRAELLLQSSEGGFTSGARHLAERLPGTVFLACPSSYFLGRPFVRFDVDKPTPSEQRRIWNQALGSAAGRLDAAIDSLAEQFRLSARTIASTSALVTSSAEKVKAHGLWDACRALARPRMDDLADRIEPKAEWADLILPEAQTKVLRQLASQVRHRMKVYEEWGFSAKGRRGLGVTALFYGDSGTGKTLAAEVIARDLGLDLYRIDLSSVVSKYIGETEKNLKRVFDAADGGGAILLFDEADALFGKRGEVKDSHDRYANIEVGYLLQRMEAFQGLAILTTNMKSSMDRAFQRRLRFTISFPFPDAPDRQAIWKRVFPVAMPSREIETAKLAQLNMAGGNIRNIALNAAFQAAAAKTPVTMENLLAAAQLEAEKIERPLSAAETRGWV